jgi:pimeloyl-ACP methyl ester carboxylesterase
MCQVVTLVMKRLFLLTLCCASSAVAVTPCHLPGWRHEVLCGHIEQPLNVAQPTKNKIDIHYVVSPAMARRKLPDPVFFLAGGPGQSAIGVAPQVLSVLARLNNRRDVVLVDQRGTGQSAPLVCAESGASLSIDQQLVQLQRCRNNFLSLPYIQSPDDLKFFTTTVAMQDLDAVRRHLGYERINLIGVSYGTRAALEYQRQFPNAVRRSVLDGVAPPDMVLPASMSMDSQAVLDAMFAACELESACQKTHPHLRADWAKVLAALPQMVSLPNSLTGQPQTTTLTRERLLGAVRGSLYSPVWVSALPVAIHEASQGRPQGLMGLAQSMSFRKKMAPATGMHFSVVCAEDVPRLASAQKESGVDFSDDQAQLYQKICNTWPRAQVPSAFYEINPSATPTLLLSGTLDPVTPPRHAQRVTAALGATAMHVVVPHAGHGVMALGCVPDVLFRFLNASTDSQALSLDAQCAQRIPRPMFFQLTTTTDD